MVISLASIPHLGRPNRQHGDVISLLQFFFAFQNKESRLITGLTTLSHSCHWILSWANWPHFLSLQTVSSRFPSVLHQKLRRNIFRCKICRILYQHFLWVSACFYASYCTCPVSRNTFMWVPWKCCGQCWL
jgi:hypothetical protein